MEQVVDHPGVEALRLDFQIHRRIHVHGNRLDPSTDLRAHTLEEGANGLAAPTLTDPQHLLGIGTNRHCGIAMPLVQSELIHDQAADSAQVWCCNVPVETAKVDGLDGVPMIGSSRTKASNQLTIARVSG